MERDGEVHDTDCSAVSRSGPGRKIPSNFIASVITAQATGTHAGGLSHWKCFICVTFTLNRQGALSEKFLQQGDPVQVVSGASRCFTGTIERRLGGVLAQDGTAHNNRL